MSMQQSLADALLNYAIEAGEVECEDPSRIGAEEITVVTDETQTELEETIADIADDVEKLENSNAGAEKLVEAVESLESYVGQLQALREQGTPLTGPAVQFYIQGVTASLEARSIPTQIFENEIMGLQQSFESNAVEDYSTEAEQKSEGLLKRLYNMLRAAAQAVYNYLKEFFVTMGKSAKAIEAAGTQIKRIAAGLKGDPSGDLKGSSYKVIAVGGKVNAVNALEALKSGYNGHVKDINAGIESSISGLVAAMKNPTAEAINAAGKHLMSKATSFDLPGGSKAEFKLGTGEGLDVFNGASFTISKGAAAAPEKVAPASKADIARIGDELVTIGKLMGESAKAAKATAEETQKVIKGAESALGKDKGTAEDIASARKAVQAASKAVKLTTSVIPTYTKFVGSTAKVAYAFAKASASKYGKTDGKAEQTKALPAPAA